MGMSKTFVSPDDTLVIECSPQMRTYLEMLMKTGFFGPTAETAAQRLLELKCFEMQMELVRKSAPEKG